MLVIEEQCYYQCGNGDDIDVFFYEEQIEFYIGIFDVVIVCQFLFGFWLVKWVMVIDCYVCDGESNKFKELWNYVLQMCLVIDDIGYIK